MQKDEPLNVEHEHRLAVVMNGGVSLAVWMGGVAFELDSLRRASSGIAVPESASVEERAVNQLWLDACRQRQVTVKVDVMAGTSAGGLNGVLSAVAIGRGAPLTGLRDLWMKTAQLSTDCLFRPQAGGPTSVLNGDFFLDEIQKALAAMEPNEGDARDVSLTVTATSLHGGQRAVRDSFGQMFAEPDARRRYAFSRREGPITYTPAGTGGDPFSQTPLSNDFVNHLPIGRAARASASFPGAFGPVAETDDLRAFRSWPDFRTGTELEWLADGGILDNSPFEPVLRAIASQPVVKPWERTLCYIVPSGNEARLGKDLRTVPASQGTEPLPPPWTSVVAAAFGLPREADFRDDVEQIHDLIRGGRSTYDVKRFLSLLDPSPSGVALFTKAVELATEAMPLYTEARAAAGIYEVYEAVVDGVPEAYLDPEFECDPKTVISTPHPWLATEFPTELPSAWTFGLAGTERVLRTMLRALRLTPDADEARDAIDTASRRCSAVRQAVLKQLGDAGLPETGMSPAWAADLADRTFNQLAAPAALAGLVRDAATAFAAAPGQAGADALKVVQAALCVEITNGAGGVPVDPTPHPILRFLRVGIADPPAFLSDPQDAATLAKAPSDILYGTRLNHFASFARPQWRAWDWMWGRLHAATHFARLLGFSDEETEAILRAIVAAEGRTPEDVTAEVHKVAGLEQAELIADLRADGIAAAALDGIFALLASERQTDPALPSVVKEIGGWVAAIGARTKPSNPSFLVRLARAGTGLLRRMIWRRALPGKGGGKPPE